MAPETKPTIIMMDQAQKTAVRKTSEVHSRFATTALETNDRTLWQWKGTMKNRQIFPKTLCTVQIVETRDNFIIANENRPRAILSPTPYDPRILGFMISATVGASKPASLAAALRTIDMSFIRSGVCPNSAKKMSTIPSSGPQPE